MCEIQIWTRSRRALLFLHTLGLEWWQLCLLAHVHCLCTILLCLSAQCYHVKLKHKTTAATLEIPEVSLHLASLWQSLALVLSRNGHFRCVCDLTNHPNGCHVWHCPHVAAVPVPLTVAPDFDQHPGRCLEPTVLWKRSRSCLQQHMMQTCLDCQSTLVFQLHPGCMVKSCGEHSRCCTCKL